MRDVLKRRIRYLATDRTLTNLYQYARQFIPLVFEIIAIISSFFSYALTKTSQPFIFWALLAETTTFPSLSSSVRENRIFHHFSFFSPMVLNSLISKIGLILYNLKTTFLVFVTTPSIILPSAGFEFLRIDI